MKYRFGSKPYTGDKRKLTKAQRAAIPNLSGWKQRMAIAARGGRSSGT